MSRLADTAHGGTVSWWRRVGPWLGIGASPVALMVGGGVADGNERWWLLASVLAGALALALIALAQGALGARTRARFPTLAARTLGVGGSRFIASPVIVVLMLGWYGFNSGIAGDGLAHLIGSPRWVGILLFAAVMLAVAWRGLNALSLAALVAGIATIVLAGDGLRRALDGHDGPLLGDGVPAGNLSFLTAVTIMVGYGAAFALRTPDFTHDLRRPRDVVWCAGIGLFLPLVLFALAGAILRLATGSWDLVEVLGRIGSPTVAYAFVTLGFTGSVLTNLHSGAIAIEDLTGRATSHRRALLVMAVAGTALALVDLASRMVPFLTVMAVAAPCLVVVIWMATNRGETTFESWMRPGPITAWILGAGTGAILAILDSPWALPAALAVAGGTMSVIGFERSRDRRPV